MSVMYIEAGLLCMCSRALHALVLLLLLLLLQLLLNAYCFVIYRCLYK